MMVKLKFLFQLIFDDIKIVENSNHSRDIILDNDLTMRMRYPSLEEFIKTNFSSENGAGVDESFQLIASCIDQVFNEEESWNTSDCSKKN